MAKTTNNENNELRIMNSGAPYQFASLAEAKSAVN